jgi:hypothetical protein
MSAARPLTRGKRFSNYMGQGAPVLSVAQARQLRKTDLRRAHERPRKQRVRVRLIRRLRREQEL